jgi:hypothetical protein
MHRADGVSEVASLGIGLSGPQRVHLRGMAGDAFGAGEVPRPVSDPEFTLVLAQARQEARALVGPAAAELLPPIPDDHVRQAMRDVLPSLLANLTGDEGNVLLTLARMSRTATTGEFVTKDAAAGNPPPAGRHRSSACLRPRRVSWPNKRYLGNPPNGSAPSGNLSVSQDS